MTSYNYEKFSSKEYELGAFRGPTPGVKAPDARLERLDGSFRQLLDFKGEFCVIETGSVTCPLFQSRMNGMETLVKQHPNVDFVILYVREAHPGAQIPQHKSMSDKLSCARLVEDARDDGREVLVDDLEGSAHKAYGSYPNAVFILNKQGCVVFSSDWNDPVATSRALDLLEKGKPANVRSLFKPARPPVAIRTLKQGGKGAAADFFKSLPSLIWHNLIRRNLRVLLGAQPEVFPDVKC